MPAPKKSTAPAQPEAVVVIEITDSDKESRAIDIGDQHVSFTAPTANILTLKATALAARAVMEIKDDATLMVADDELRQIKGAMKALDSMRESVSKPLYQAWEANNAIYRQPMETLKQAAAKLTNSITGYHMKVEEAARIERQKAEQEAEAERQRLAAEARVAEEQASQSAMLGDTEEAEATFERAESLEMASQLVTAREVDVAPAKIVGSSILYRYSAQVPTSFADVKAALTYILANPQFLELVDFNQAACNRLAVALKDNFAIPGIKVVKTPIVAQRGVRATPI